MKISPKVIAFAVVLLIIVIFVIYNSMVCFLPQTPIKQVAPITNLELAGTTQILVGFEQTVNKPITDINITGLWTHTLMQTGSDIPKSVTNRSAMLYDDPNGVRIDLFQTDTPANFTSYVFTRNDVNDYSYDDQTISMRLVVVSPNKFYIYVKNNGNLMGDQITNTFVR